MPQLPPHITNNLTPAFPLREYQQDALARFVAVTEQPDPQRHLLFHMATGSGKTLVMAGCMLQLYALGYRRFLFFVNSNTIIKKTRANFLDDQSSKYLFAQTLSMAGNPVKLHEVSNFQSSAGEELQIVFTTIQGLHKQLAQPRENGLTLDDFAAGRTVMISDESHHINALTKKGKPTTAQLADLVSWEQTVERIHTAHSRNYLLEFTATAALDHPAIATKYQDALLFEYSLRAFCADRYSKDIQVLQSSQSIEMRVLQALLLSVYRQEVFAWNNVWSKPVVLIKSSTIADSVRFRESVDLLIDQLDAQQIGALREDNTDNVIAEAFQFFNSRGVQDHDLIASLQREFQEGNRISIDSRNDSDEKQLIINSLEDRDNPYRLIFAVDKLNEGWDVLNLFDIVRTYDSKQPASKIPAKTTVAEAQLIGRGARYFPFQLHPDQEKHRRKYDDEPSNPLRVCEELYYHAGHNPEYIRDLGQALIETGLRTQPIQVRKANSIQTQPASQVRATTQNTVDWISEQQGKHWQLDLRPVAEGQLLQEESGTPYTSIKFSDLPQRVLQKAVQAVPGLRFDRLKRLVPDLERTQQLFDSDLYLGNTSIEVLGEKDLRDVSPARLRTALVRMLEHLN